MRQIILFITFLGGGALFAQPHLVITPNISATPLGSIPSRSLFCIRDPFNIKIFNFETANFLTVPLTGLQISTTSADQRITVWVSAVDGGFKGIILDHESENIKSFAGDDDVDLLQISPDNRYLVVESEKSIVLFSVETATELATYSKKSNRPGSCCFRGNSLLVLGKKEIEILDVPDLKKKSQISFTGNFTKFLNNGTSYLSDSKIYDTETGKQTAVLQTAVSRAPFPFDNTPLLSPDGKQIAVFNNLGKFFLAVYDINSGQQVFKKDLSKEIGGITSAMYFQVDPAWRFFTIANKSNGVTVFDLKTGEEKCQIYSMGPEDILITIPSGYYMATRKGALEGANYEMDGQFFDFVQFDQFYNRPDLVLAHIGLSPDTTIDRFKKVYERRLERLRESGVVLNIDNFNAPEAKLEQELPVFTGKTKLEVSIFLEDKKEILDRMNVYVNGVPLYGRKGFSLKYKKVKKYNQSLSIPLTPGDNKVEIEVVNQANTVSKRIQHTVRCEAPERKPTLHLVTIGVANYRDSEKNLLYPDDDVQDVEKLFLMKGEVYDKVISYRLWESEFSEETLKKTRKELLKSKETDHVIIFYAGHGIIDHNSKYYLGSTNIDFSAPAHNGIMYTSVEALLDSIPARKRLMFIDACFSGEIDTTNSQRVKIENTVKREIQFNRSGNTGFVPGLTENERIFNLMRTWFTDLTVGTGATILSGTGGMEVAVEGEQWDNGAYTWCLLEGLDKRKADSNQDGKIMLSELRNYLEITVSNQTDKQQQPSFRAENLVIDWQIW